MYTDFSEFVAAQAGRLATWRAKTRPWEDGPQSRLCRPSRMCPASPPPPYRPPFRASARAAAAAAEEPPRTRRRAARGRRYPQARTARLPGHRPRRGLPRQHVRRSARGRAAALPRLPPALREPHSFRAVRFRVLEPQSSLGGRVFWAKDGALSSQFARPHVQ
jgi:hypothetical protein